MSEGLTIRESRDFAALNQWLRRPEIYAACFDDEEQREMPREAVDASGLSAKPTMRLLHVELLAEGHRQSQGGFVLEEMTPGMWLAHAVLGPECRGARAVRAAVLGLQHCFEQLQAKVVGCEVPRDNRAAVWVALRAGFKVSGKGCGWRRGGQEIGRTIVAISRGEWLAERNRLCR